MRYVIVTGSGRSGTNWVLDSFDASPVTHCRNEPHALRGTPLHAFPLVWSSDEPVSRELYRARWDEVAEGTARRYGARDHHLRHPKAYLHPWANQLGLSRAMTGPRLRQVLSRVDPGLRGLEWELPRWLGSRRELESSVGVLKILIDAPLLSWILDERREVPVVHVLRHPGGRLHSFMTRHAAGLDEGGLERQRLRRVAELSRIRAHDEQWRDVIPDPEGLDLTLLEVWFWRYVNETTLAAGQGHDRYRLVTFDALARDPEGEFGRLYAHAGLDWTDEVRSRVVADASRSVWDANVDPREVSEAWRTRLDSAHVRAIDEVLQDSPLREVLAGGTEPV